MAYTAFTKFEHFKGEDFQTETEIRVDCDKLLGVVVMINPGRLRRPTGYGDWVRTPLGSTFSYVISIVEDAYRVKGERLPPGGYIKMCNLFDLADSDLESALSKTEKLPDRLNFYSIRHIPKDAPWIWFAWGSEKKSERLKGLMQQVVRDFSGSRIVGLKIPSEDAGYYHPQYLKKNGKKSFIKDILIGQISNFLDIV